MKTICVFGDSITWGRGLASRVSWANLLRNHLEDKDPSAHLYDLGVDGNTTHDLLDRCEQEALSRKPDTIIWAIGVNDAAYRSSASNPLVSESAFIKNLSLLFEKGSELSNQQFVIGITKGSDAHTMPLPDSKTGKSYEKARVALYDDLLAQAAARAHLNYISIAESLDDEDFYDGLHPNEAGHRKIFMKIQTELSP